MKKFLSMVFAALTLTSAFAAKTRTRERIVTKKIASLPKQTLVNGECQTIYHIARVPKKTKFKVQLNSRAGHVYFMYVYEFQSGRIVLDKQARASLVAAYDKYLQEYDEKKLNRKQKKFKPVYGAERIRFDWGAANIIDLPVTTLSSTDDPKLFMGYRFINNSPYFTLRVDQCKDKNQSQFSNYYAPCMLYFTRAQAAEFIDAIREENITELVSKLLAERTASKDDYVENDGEEMEGEESEAAFEYSEDEGKESKLIF